MTAYRKVWRPMHWASGVCRVGPALVLLAGGEIVARQPVHAAQQGQGVDRPRRRCPVKVSNSGRPRLKTARPALLVLQAGEVLLGPGRRGRLGPVLVRRARVTGRRFSMKWPSETTSSAAMPGGEPGPQPVVEGAVVEVGFDLQAAGAGVAGSPGR